MLANIATSEIWKKKSLNLVIVDKEDLVNFGSFFPFFWGGEISPNWKKYKLKAIIPFFF
jgi:hypothetical protein